MLYHASYGLRNHLKKQKFGNIASTQWFAYKGNYGNPVNQNVTYAKTVGIQKHFTRFRGYNVAICIIFIQISD